MRVKARREARGAFELPFRVHEDPVQDRHRRVRLTVGPGESGANPIELTQAEVRDAVIVNLKRLLVASGSSTGTTGSVTGASSVERPPSTQSGSPHEGSGWGWPLPP